MLPGQCCFDIGTDVGRIGCGHAGEIQGGQCAIAAGVDQAIDMRQRQRFKPDSVGFEDDGGEDCVHVRKVSGSVGAPAKFTGGGVDPHFFTAADVLGHHDFNAGGQLGRLRVSVAVPPLSSGGVR